MQTKKTESIRFDVYGRRLVVESTGNAWSVWHQGADGRRRPAEDIQIPRQLDREDIESYLADVCHEWASPHHPKVQRLT